MQKIALQKEVDVFPNKKHKTAHEMNLNIMIRRCLSMLVFLFFSMWHLEIAYASIHPIKITERKKLGLIIAISSYDFDKTGWMPLNATNDILLIKNALTKQGFSDTNISILKDEKANKKSIVNAFNDLIAKAQEGDIVVIHYSGHGQQIFDDNNDEIDGFDESLVPWDAPAYFGKIPNYTGSNHIRDDELGMVIRQLRTKVGNNGHVIVILDSCHSGTGTRGSATSRGGEPFAPPGYRHKSMSKDTEQGFGVSSEESTSSRGASKPLGKFVLFTGANFDEVNNETLDEKGRPVGSLSYALSKSLSSVGPTDSYRTIFARTQKIMADVAPFQHPTLEGDVDYQLFNGEIIPQEDYFSVLKINRKDTREWTINSGEISGITEGSTLYIFPAGTPNSQGKLKAAIGTATVKSAKYFSAVVTSDHALKNPKAVWLFLKEKSFGHQILRVNLDEISNSTIKNNLRTGLQSASTVSLVSEGHDIIVKPAPTTRGSMALNIISNDSSFDCNIQGFNTDACISSIKQFSIGHFLNQLQNDDENYAIDIEFIPVRGASLASGKLRVQDTLSIETFGGSMLPSFPEETQFLLKVINKGKKRAFFNILDIQPDGVVNPIIPNTEVSIFPEECVLGPSEERIIPDFYVELYPPYGIETYKIFASKSPIYLSSLLTKKGNEISRGDFSGMEMLMIEAAHGSRGSKTFSLETSDGSIGNYRFRIIEK